MGPAVLKLVLSCESALPRLAVQVERRRAETLVVARTNEEQPRVVIEARFAGDARGVSLELSVEGAARRFSAVDIAKHPAISALLRLIADEAEQPRNQGAALLESLLRSVMVYVERIDVLQPLTHWGRPVRDVHVERAVALLNADIAKRWTVELLAKAVGLSRPAFARRFLAVLALSPMRYLTQRRMQIAAALLFSSDAALAEVASRVGYDSEFAFSRAFKRHYHMPPGEYRRVVPTLGAVALGAVNRAA